MEKRGNDKVSKKQYVDEDVWSNTLVILTDN